MTQAVATAAGSFAASSTPDDSIVASGPAIQLNAFQMLMRRWSTIHPYSAGQVMRVSGAGDRERWKRAIEGVLGELGLGKVQFGAGDESVRFFPPQTAVVEQSSQDLQSFFNDELNRPFAAGDLPIRFCLLPAGEGSHYLAAVYDHWIADSRAMRDLMNRIFERYQYPAAKARLAPLTLQAPPFKKIFRKYLGIFPQLTATIEAIKNIWHHKGTYRLTLWRPLDFTSRFLHRELPDGLINRLHSFAKSRGASVNDLFIAVAAQTMGKYTAADRLGRRKKLLHFGRRRIGIGTIVDIREAANQPLDGVFNLYLSSYTVVLDSPEQRSAEAVMRDAAALTRIIKKSMKAIRTFSGLAAARFWYDLYDSPKFRATLLHKTVSLVAGISNVNMTGSWVDTAAPAGNKSPAEELSAPQILDYLRISPTGPLIPLVFTLTTIRERLSLCVTYRTASFHEERLVSAINDFIERLQAAAAEA